MDKPALAAREAALARRAGPWPSTLSSVRQRAAQAARRGGPGVRLASAAVSVPGRLARPLRSGAAVRRGEAPAVVGRIEGRPAAA